MLRVARLDRSLPGLVRGDSRGRSAQTQAQRLPVAGAGRAPRSPEPVRHRLRARDGDRGRASPGRAIHEAARGPTDQDRLEISWRMRENGNTEIEFEFDAAVSFVPGYLPVCSAGDAIAEAILGAAAERARRCPPIRTWPGWPRRRSSAAATTSRCCSRIAGTARPSCFTGPRGRRRVRALGVAPGERVVVSMANRPEVSIVYQALWRAGAVVTPATFLLPAEDLRHVIVDSGACGVITTSEFVDKVPSRGCPRWALCPPTPSDDCTARATPSDASSDAERRARRGRAARAERSAADSRARRRRPGRAAVHRRHDRAGQGRDAVARQP